MTTKKIYKIIFYNNEDIFEIYAAHVFASDLYGFVEVEQLLFGEKSQLLVDPSEERLKNEFSGVKRTFIPMNAVVRIDEVEQSGTPKVSGVRNSVTNFPNPSRPEK
jgi:hypothetical protein|tara:strand:- start:575 stop:892 length:318 start_codon:yes stop_codon:yes gene_type:complete